jgi:hypothetical protein
MRRFGFTASAVMPMGRASCSRQSACPREIRRLYGSPQVEHHGIVGYGFYVCCGIVEACSFVNAEASLFGGRAHKLRKAESSSTITAC